MTRVAAGRGSRGLPVGSVSEVAAQMPPASDQDPERRVERCHRARARAAAIPAETTTIVTAAPRHAAAKTRAVVRAPIAHAQPDQHAERRERDRNDRIEQRQRPAETAGRCPRGPNAMSGREQERHRRRRRRPRHNPAPAPRPAPAGSASRPRAVRRRHVDRDGSSRPSGSPAGCRVIAPASSRGGRHPA